MVKFGVVSFPGSNCDADMVYVLEELLGQQVVRLWHKDRDIQSCDWIILPGGFSYGDYLRSGAIARFSPIMEAVIAHANRGGYVLGICNGFQILCESGLLDGVLLHNTSHQFICKNTYLKVGNSDTVLTKNLDENEVYTIPIAHGQGRFYAPEQTIKKMQDNEQIVFYYSDQNGQIDQQHNPNGSLFNIAGICNAKKNIFGMMPHPERASDPLLNSTDGHLLFHSLLTNS